MRSYGSIKEYLIRKGRSILHNAIFEQVISRELLSISFKFTADTRHHNFSPLNRCSLTTLQDQNKMIDHILQLLYFSHIKSRHVIQTLVTDRTNKPNLFVSINCKFDSLTLMLQLRHDLTPLGS